MSHKVKFVVFALLAIGTTAIANNLLAQSIPGIYGGASLNELGAYRYVQLQGESGSSYTYPLNGILNYVAYYFYNPNEFGFIPGGTYSVYYLNSSEQVVGSAGTVTYSPNSTYTNGVEVSPPNPGANGPLGIQGTIKPVGGSTSAVTLTNSSGNVVANVVTNGDGFFSFYYSNGLNIGGGFVPPGSYSITSSASYTLGKCLYLYTGSGTATYSPSNSTNPDATSYYVTNAAVVAQIKTKITKVSTPICP